MNLNKKQQEAVSHTEGPLLILAGAGSGKTKVLVHKIAHLISSRQAIPEEIMAVTFTNKAASELKSRIIELVGDSGKFVNAGTFHSICSRILRQFADRLELGYESNFVIYDTDDKNRVLKNILKELELPTLTFPVKKISNLISGLKNKLIYPDNFSEEITTDFVNRYFSIYNPFGNNEIEDDSNALYLTDKLKEIYSLYQEEMQRCNAFDFDDLICMVLKLFEIEEEVKFIFQNQIKYLLVDEYQDTNHVQELLIKTLSEIYNNICVVGDEDQSIYSWRGAEISNILSFHKRYKPCKTVKLEENYRSTANILDTANFVISNNKERLGKKLYTNLGVGEKVKLLSSESDSQEAFKCMEIVTNLVTIQDTNLNDIAFLYRTNSQSRVLEENLRKYGYSYTIVGGVKFYERKEIKDIIAYLKVLINPNDNVNLERIINFPPRKIGKASFKHIKYFAYEEGLSLYDSLSEYETISGLSTQARNGIKKFLKLIHDAKKKLDDREKADSICNFIFEDSKLKEYYIGESDKNDSNKIDNLYEFLSSVSNFIEDENEKRDNDIQKNIVKIDKNSKLAEKEVTENESTTLIDFLESVSLLSDIDSFNENDDKITLMSVHSSKGLEFKNVIITGLNERLFPIIRENELEDPKKLEEETRLFYVAATRAKERLYLSYYKFRRKFFGDFDGYSPSRFIVNLPEEFVDKRDYDYTDTSIMDEEYNEQSKYNHFKYKNSSGYEIRKKKKTITFDFKKGEWIVSKQFGEGKIEFLEGENDKMTALIDFDDYGLKKLMLKFANLTRLNIED